MISYSIERAKNDNYTIKDLTTGKYIYSKYKPENVHFDYDVNSSADRVLFIGAGLGYELVNLRRQTTIPIMAVEVDENLSQHIEPIEACELYSTMDIKKIKNKVTSATKIIINAPIFNLNKSIYEVFLQSLIQRNQVETLWLVDNDFVISGAERVFNKLGYNTTIVKEKQLLDALINNPLPDYVFGCNYTINVSEICKRFSVKYIAWNYDSPWTGMFKKELKDAQHAVIFDFDKDMVDRIKREMDVDIYYMPLAANMDYINAISLSEEEKIKYGDNVTFIAQSSADCAIYKDVIGRITNKKILEQLVSVIDSQVGQHSYLLNSLNLEKFYKYIFTVEQQKDHDKYISYKKSEFASLEIAKATSHIERKKVAEELSKVEKFSLYGDYFWELYPFTKGLYRGIADYDIEAYKIMRACKINVNDTRAHFGDAVPLRMFDIIGSNGFCVSNYKQQNNPIFIDGKHAVYYRDYQDLEEIIRYYLTHEQERLQIRDDAYDFVLNYHTLELRLKHIMDKAREVFEVRDLKI